MQKIRKQRINVCKECNELNLNCADGQKCAAVREPLQQFYGIRHTADGFDCALPVTIDSHSYCAYECLYCFSDNLQGHIKRPVIKQTNIKDIERIISGESNSKYAQIVRKALKYDRRNVNGFPCPIQIGGLTDPCDSIEQNQGWLLEVMKLAIEYNQPLRLSTKGAIFLIKEYQDIIKKAPHLFWVAFSMITPDDYLIRKVDRYAPDATTRLKTMKLLNSFGVKTSLRLRPIIHGITDRKNGHIELINRAADAGAGAISYEVFFYPNRLPKSMRWKYKLLNKIAGIDLYKIYSSFGKLQACTRPSYLWTENIMHEIKEHAQQRGMSIGISDPVWKQLTECGCCCGIKPDDPVFGNWERENATNALLEAKRNKKPIYFKDINPPWSKNMLVGNMVNLGAGPKVAYDKRHKTWEDKLRDNWNDIKSERSVMNYFQGALIPKGIDKNGDRIYIYKGLDRKNMLTKFGTNFLTKV